MPALKSFPGVRGSAPGGRPEGGVAPAYGHYPLRAPAVRTGKIAPRDLDTSAQLRIQPAAPQTPLAKRARRKYLSRAIGSALADYAKTIEDPAGLGNLWEKSYRNTAYCAEELTQEDGKITGRYCGNRWCLVCSAIRTARTWERHGPVIESWRRPQFVTITRRNVPRAELAREIASMLKDAAKIADSMRNTDHVPLVALRKLECTYNAGRDDYHPHFHLLIETRQMARLFVARWMDLCGDRADWKAQKVTDANRSALAELLKYFTKLVAKQKMVAPADLHPIFVAMKGRRVYQNVGYNLETDDDEESEIELEESTPATTRSAELIVWSWCQDASDWVDADTGECLTDYEPGARFRAFVESIG